MRSKRLRVKSELAVLRAHGQAVRIYQLRGRLIFASLETVMRTILREAPASTHLILDLALVADLDRASCRLLLDLRDQLTKAGIRIHVTGGHDKPSFRNFVVAQFAGGGWEQLCRDATRDEVLEVCENEILRQHGGAEIVGGVVPLGLQELCRGFSAGELHDLSERLATRELPAGSEVIAASSMADAMFFLTRGEVGIFLKPTAGEEQLISRLGPGMSFGEVALVDREPKSATVRALGQIQVLRLGFDAFDRLADEGLVHLQTKLISNLASVLAARLRSANAEIRSLK